ncbi:MAG TPA: dienelactone hydrolase family protein [Rhodanobacteraceae bacterium]|jgi:dienelactone hydrolase|nr:dienelactone hydrolase family protein [Rhodanobacteraceae bacterium]
MRKTLLALLLLFGFASLAHAAMRTQTVDYSVDGKAMQGVLVWDDAVKAPRPGLLMIPDWVGINPVNIDFARSIAGKDYVIFMGDMYGKDLRPKDNKEAQAATKPLYADRAMLRRRVAAAFAELKALAAKHAAPIDASRLAAIGFCFGGTSVLDLARSGSDVAAVVSFHGGLATDDPALAKQIKARVLAMNGADDKGTMPDAPAFMKEMQQSPAPWQFVAFGGAVHCFAEPQAHSPPGCVYDPHVAKRAFALMRVWLDEAFAGKN